MTDEDRIQLRVIIHDEIEAAIKDRFKPLLEKLDNLTHTADGFYSQLDEDRKDIAFVKTSQSTVERLCRELIDIVATNSKRQEKSLEEKVTSAVETIGDRVAERVEPAMAQTMKKVKNNIPLSEHPWYKKLFRR